jgi:hypothetical protein
MLLGAEPLGGGLYPDKGEQVRVPLPEIRQDSAGPILGTVIHDNDLESLPGVDLDEKGFQAGAYPLFLVPGRDEDGDRRLFPADFPRAAQVPESVEKTAAEDDIGEIRGSQESQDREGEHGKAAWMMRGWELEICVVNIDEIANPCAAKGRPG